MDYVMIGFYGAMGVLAAHIVVFVGFLVLLGLAGIVGLIRR